MVMIKANIHDLKVNLSSYLMQVARGEVVVICKRNVPIAEVRPLPSSSKHHRPVGLAKNILKINKTFFDPLPNSLLKAFNFSDK